MDTNGHQDPSAFVNKMLGLPCWYVSTGGAAGSTFELALGNKVPRPRRLKNPAHSEEFRLFDGEANLLIWCAWRLDGSEGPLTSWDDTDANIKAMLAKLVGAAVESVAVTPMAWDLTLRFTADLTLRVFCDHVPGDPSFDGNWELWLADRGLCVGPGTRWTLESRSELAPPTVPVAG